MTRDVGTWRSVGRRAVHSSLFPVMVLAGVVMSTRSAQIDDAYISYRYAANLTAGRGLVFNTGQRVEGMSNLLWTLLVAGLREVGISPPLAGRLLGIASLAGTVVLTRRVAVHYGMGPITATATAAGVALTGDLAASATVGLEGGLYAALLLSVLLVWDRPDRHWIAFGLAVSALAATRPEGLVLGAALAATILLLPGHARRARFLASGGAFFGIVLIECARYAYYREFVPMSVTAKRDIGSSLLRSVQRHSGAGSRYLYGFLGRPLLLLAGVSLLLMPAVLRYARSDSERRLPTVLLPMMVALACGLSLPLLSGGDWMPHWRLVTPYSPVLYLAVGLALVTIGSATGRLAAAMLPFLLAPAFPAFLPHHILGTDRSSSAEAYDQLGLALERTPLHGRVVASDVLGRMSYYGPDVAVTDMFGLTEPAVAKTPGPGGPYGKSNLAYTLSLHPAVVVTNYWPKERDLLAIAATHGRPNAYVAVTSLRLSSLRVFLIAEEPFARPLADTLRAFDPSVAPGPVDEAIALWAHDFPRGF